MQIARFLLLSVLIGLSAASLFLVFRGAELNPSQHEQDTAKVEVVQSQELASNIGYGPFSYASAVNSALPAVVNIYTAKRIQQRPQFNNPLYDRFFGRQYNDGNSRIETGSGSGVIFSDKGYLLTNYHVIEGAQGVHVLLADGRDFPATVIGVDPETDLAVLHIEVEDVPSITLAPSMSINIGDVVLAIGNPFGVGQTVTMGIVSATGRDRLGLNTFENFIQTDAAINPGNSGGALVNARGELVGINTAIFTRDGGSQGIGFAIPVDVARDVLTQILQHGRVIRGWIGAEGRDLSAFGKKKLGLDHGVVIVGVVQGGPAYLAGIRQGDIITEIDNKPVKDVRGILEAVSSRSPGEAMKVTGIRHNQTYEATLVVVQRPLISTR